MNTMNKKIIFTPTIEDADLIVPAPKPSKFYIPDWFKEIPGINLKNMEINDLGNPNLNIKNCIPFLDGLMSGYIQETWTDIFIKENDGDIEYHTASKPNPTPIGHREKNSYPKNDFYYEHEFIWRQPWIPKLPNAYSYLLTHPLGRIDLPFTTISAIVDADKLHYSNNPRVPFYIKKGFSGIIPSGTPMYQMIPFKRDSWDSESENFSRDKVRKGIQDLRKNFLGSYKNRYWSKKDYN